MDCTPIYPKETEGKQFIFLLLGFPPANDNTQYGDDKELEDIESIDAVKIHEDGHFYHIFDIHRFLFL